MICYMPFTYIEEKIISRIIGVLGPVAVCGLIPEAVPDHMRTWAQKELLDLWYPRTVRADQLCRAMEEFKAWADMHQGNIAEMVGFQKTCQGRPPLVDETHPTRIRDRIRHYGQQTDSEHSEALFQAALFLCMAQEHDRQHGAVVQDMGTVQAMEQAMLARLSGDGADTEDGISQTGTAKASAPPADVGAHMTSKRVQAWARLAADESRSYSAYLTTSPAVFEHVSELFPEMRGPLSLRLDNNAGDKAGTALHDLLKALSLADDPVEFACSLSQEQPHGSEISGLALYPLVGIGPHQFLDRLCGAPSLPAPSAAAGQVSVHTLIGFLNIA